jgi:hypothetical protein
LLTTESGLKSGVDCQLFSGAMSRSILAVNCRASLTLSANMPTSVVRRSRIEIERADEYGLVIDHHAFRVQCEYRVIYCYPRVAIDERFLYRRMRLVMSASFIAGCGLYS